jgi:hypothetical protein
MQMNDNMFGLKEMYDCILKATYDMKIGSRLFKAGEPIAVFDSLALANIDEIKSRISAKGGYSNKTWITWESTQEVKLNFSRGIFSKIHLAILGNSGIADSVDVEVPMHEEKEVDENLMVELKHSNPINIFIYANGERIENYTIEDNKIIFVDIRPYTDIDIYYNFLYKNANAITIGQQLVSGFLEFTAKTRLKDDITGKTVTGIIHMPKVKLMSDFSIRLGNDAPPATGFFAITAYPTGSKGSERVMEFISLNDDIDSDF